MQRIIIFDYYNTIFNPKTQALFPGTPRLLLDLKQKADLYLITTRNKKRKSEIIKLGIRSCFTKIIFCIKKKPSLFKKLLKDKGLVVIIGDRIDEEISVAKKLNYPFILVNSEKENPIVTIKKKLPYLL